MKSSESIPNAENFAFYMRFVVKKYNIREEFYVITVLIFLLKMTLQLRTLKDKDMTQLVTDVLESKMKLLLDLCKTRCVEIHCSNTPL